MAALASTGGLDLSGPEFFRHVEQLPGYARPVFVRVIGQADMTGTFKVRKVELKQQGFDPGLVADPLYVLVDRARGYQELTPRLHARIRSGQLRVP